MLVTDNIVLVSSTVGREGIDIDSVLTVDSTSEGVTSVVNLEVGVQGRGVIEYTCSWSEQRRHQQKS